MKGDANDPRALIKEAYRIEGISAGECRTIFLDWALGVPAGQDPKPIIERLLLTYASQPEDHPMTKTLKEALISQGPARRKGGRAGRLQS